MATNTIDATISSIELTGDYITRKITLECYDQDLKIMSVDIDVLPGLRVNIKKLLASYQDTRPLTFRVCDFESGTLLGQQDFEFNPVITDGLEKQPYTQQIQLTGTILTTADDLIPAESGGGNEELSGDGSGGVGGGELGDGGVIGDDGAVLTGDGVLNINYCIHPSTNIGKTDLLLSKLDCMLRFYNDANSDRAVASNVSELISNLYTKLYWALDYSHYNFNGASVYETDLTIKTTKVKLWLEEVKNNPSRFRDIDLYQIKDWVNYTYNYFTQHAPYNYCSPNGVKWTKKESHKLQSKELYLQANGSTGDTGVTRGVLLRWSLNGELGANHIPKGVPAIFTTNSDGSPNPYYSTTGYGGRKTDFVKLYKTKYENPVYSTINFNASVTVELTEGETSDEFAFMAGDNIVVFELKKNNYLTSASGILTHTSGIQYSCTSIKSFIDAYNDVFSIRVYEAGNIYVPYAVGYPYTPVLPQRLEQKKAFSVSFSLTPDSGTITTDEILFTAFEGDEPDLTYNLKKSVLQNDCTNKRFLAENVSCVHVKADKCLIDEIKFEFYDEFLYGPNRIWEYVNQYSLSIDRQVVEERLKGKNEVYDIDNNWPKYNDGVTTRADSYMDKWDSPDDGFDYQVKQYLLLSKDAANLKAKSLTPPRISFLNLLKLSALDFHVARMLGMGTIDLLEDDSDRFVYLAAFTCPSEPNGTTYVDHLHMSLPTKLSDERLPFVPALDEFTHSTDSELNDVMDENGYMIHQSKRLVNVNRELFPYEVINGLSPTAALLSNNGYFALGAEKTRAYQLGIEYGYHVINPDIELPNLSYNTIYGEPQEYKDFKNNTQVDETILVLNKPSPIFSHYETANGDHKYSLYGVDWFSRASNTSAEESLTTTFVQKTIKPPLNLRAQYIQSEDPLVFTSESEQLLLNQRIEDELPEPNFTRVTFDWNIYQNNNYQSAKEVHFFFRPSMPKEVRGKIKSVTPEGDHYAITMDKIQLITGDNSSVEPNIPSGANFIGSMLKTKQAEYTVTAIVAATNANDYPTLHLKPSTINRISEIEGSASYQLTPKSTVPAVGDYFSMQENIASESSWTKLINHQNKVVITNFEYNNLPYSETRTNAIDGSTETIICGGVYSDSAKISVKQQTIDNVYEIEFSCNLPLVPTGNTANVNFYGGSVRLKTVSGITKELNVFSIVGFGTSTLKLLALDNSPDTTDPVATASSFTGFANFHPGYRIYLEPEASFEAVNIEPTVNSNAKRTLLAAKSFDGGNSYYSSNPEQAPFSDPTVLVAIKQPIPVAPGSTQVSTLFATKPDTFGKSSFTFDIDLSTDSPFATLVYRASDRSILSQLYSDTKLAEVLNNLKNIESNLAEDKRFEELASAKLNTSGMAFNSYNGYALPLPDALGLDISDTLLEKQEKIKGAIQKAFLPITSEPCIYDFIKTRLSALTSNGKPVLSDVTGKTLLPTSTNFDPYPFMTRFTSNGVNKLRFTDYTLNGSSNSRYYYCFRNQAENLTFSNFSSYIGPVNLINSFPFEPPVVMQHEIKLANKVINAKASVKFVIQPYAESVGVKKVRLYRAFEEGVSRNVSAMSVVGDFDIEQDEVIDSFTGISLPPTEEPIYYRLVGLRAVRNELKLDPNNANSEHEIETVVSLPTNIFTVELPDNINPDAPVLSCTCQGSNATQLQNVVFSFNSVMYKGEYYLYKLNTAGAWELKDTLSNLANNVSLSFSIGNVEYKSGGNILNALYKVVARNRSGLFSLEENTINPVNKFVPFANIIGPSVTCINQATLFKTVKSNPSNTLEWRLNGAVISTTDSCTITPTILGTIQIEVIESNPSSNLTSSKIITLVVKPVPIPSVIGTTNACTETEFVYQTPSTSGNFYQWIIEGGVITFGQGTSQIGIIWNEPGNGSIKVQESNGGVIVTSATLWITIVEKPSPYVTADSPLIVGRVINLKSNTYNSKFTYEWEVGGATIIYQSLGDIQLMWSNEGDFNVQVDVRNEGHLSSSNIPIRIFSSPEEANVDGKTDPSFDSVTEYRLVDYGSNMILEWSVSEGAEVMNAHDDRIEVRWPHSDGIYWIEVSVFDIDSGQLIRFKHVNILPS